MPDLKAPGKASLKRPNSKPKFIDRLGLWLSTSRNIDGLWVGTTESEADPILCRVEDALKLIKDYDSLHYSRVLNHLARIWVHLIPAARAHYDHSLQACVLDERYILSETTTVEEIASTIVHEATHARLEKWGISYDVNRRPRIEAICVRRQCNFLTKLPHTEFLQENAARTLEWSAGEHDWFSDVSFRKREYQGIVKTLRYLDAPDWLIRFMLRIIRKRRSALLARER